eukprot:Hpha_TRINITY_DN14941_c1_g2::TRINITY_DN14941_c1_g2_i1::g.143503::m.143503
MSRSPSPFRSHPEIAGVEEAFAEWTGQGQNLCRAVVSCEPLEAALTSVVEEVRKLRTRCSRLEQNNAGLVLQLTEVLADTAAQRDENDARIRKLEADQGDTQKRMHGLEAGLEDTRAELPKVRKDAMARVDSLLGEQRSEAREELARCVERVMEESSIGMERHKEELEGMMGQTRDAFQAKAAAQQQRVSVLEMLLAEQSRQAEDAERQRARAASEVEALAEAIGVVIRRVEGLEDGRDAESTEVLLNDCADRIDHLYGCLELDKRMARGVATASTEERVRLLHSLPAFRALHPLRSPSVQPPQPPRNPVSPPPPLPLRSPQPVTVLTGHREAQTDPPSPRPMSTQTDPPTPLPMGTQTEPPVPMPRSTQTDPPEPPLPMATQTE